MGRRRVAPVLLALGFSVTGVMVAHHTRALEGSRPPMERCAPLLRATSNWVVRLELARTEPCARAIVDAWTDERITDARRSVYWGFAFIPAYAAVLVALCFRVETLAAGPLTRRAMRAAAWAVLVAAAADGVENAALLALLAGNYTPWTGVAFHAAAAKFLLVGAVLLVVSATWIAAESRRTVLLTSMPAWPDGAGWRGAASYLRYLWPLRVSVLAALFVVAFPALLLAREAGLFVRGLFDVLTEAALMPIALLALLIAWTSGIIAALVVAHGAARFDLPELRRRDVTAPGLLWAYAVPVALPIVLTTIVQSSRWSNRSVLAMSVAAAAGAIAASAMLAVALGVAHLATEYGRAKGRWPAYRRLLAFLARHPAIGTGFVDRHARELLPGHGIAAFLAVAAVGAYLWVGYDTVDVSRPELASALAYVLLLVLVLAWLLGFLAFLLDRTRAPLVVFIGAWLFFTEYVFDALWPTDHVYETYQFGTPPPEGTAARLLARSERAPIIVAASGGGIQAAAWTARVLTGLADRAPAFAADVRLLSGVSGGSVGAMHYLTQHAACGPAIPNDGSMAAGASTRTTRDEAVKHAMESSLHAAGWGLVYKDLPRTVLPMFVSPKRDRGSLLEDAWKRDGRLGADVRDAGSPAMLANWRRGLAAGCPGAIFNAMVAETGEPMLFSTAPLPPSQRRFSFQSHYPGLDVKLTTAVRLSATFPYVTPAARAAHDDDPWFMQQARRSDGRRYSHVVDGGYFDNFGLATAAEWLHGALVELQAAGQRLPPHVLLVEICEVATCSTADPGEKPALGSPDRHGWPYQIYAPVSALMSMRDAAQRARNRWQVGLLQRRWESSVCIETVTFHFPGAPGPLSWHLSETQKRNVREAWGDSRLRAAIAKVADFAAGTYDGSACAASRRHSPPPITTVSTTSR